MTNTPSDAEIEKLAAEHLKAFSQFPMGGQVWFEGEVEFARAVLAKWGTQPQAGAVPQGWKAVPVNPTPEMWKAAKTVPDPNPPYPPHYGLVWDAMLAASPTPPAEQQAAPKAAPGEQNTVPAEWLEQAYREGWAACRDAETIGEEAEDWAFGNSTANSRMIDAQQAAPKQEVQEPVMIYHGRCTIDCGEHGHHDMEMLRMIPAGSKLYTAPQPAPAPLSDDTERLEWLLWKLPGDALRYVVGELSDTSSGAEFRAAIDAALAAQGGK